MVDYGTVRSTVKPDDVEIRETKVFIASNIQEVSENVGEENEFVGYEYGLQEYEKDEYILLQAQRNETLEKQVVDTQIALCEVYELMA